ncbi:alpha-ketoglutarate-dependent dioxygenase AlkB [Phyllobacterium endophyticum]|uniref:Alpha-ketoglutarate-dependent dioxygenase AlkB n=1 Tax=Phyllobacterium endophyticum TaxID=1149773 RepID=A0A2P7AP45_9HYPH|nr:alpha-ketoglutarate-dependent dioxygenase AlkB [Phyllobacterium endophyticum]PSH55980.1 alpha-ketoglutarate-dependent dioxygenase AlkB [Phyllobacterium endophyticum]TYR41123.1 alpha-ketoglutarate-dependent dioxygenase AlkB [Phyllobacterium endophyticum]
MQTDLFGKLPTELPEGFKYAPDVVSSALQQSLLQELPKLPFEAFDFHGFKGRRRVVSYGWKYDFDAEKLGAGPEIPRFLFPVRRVAARFAGLSSEQLQHALITEYSPGAPIGWHKDKAVFGVVVGISLLSACTFRLRRKINGKWERVSIIAEPGSAYLMSGSARTEWEHSIPPVDRLRYSITFRELRTSS